jgi:hypothetical protein
VGDGSLLAASLIIGCGSRGGSTLLSWVVAGERDPSRRRARHRCSPWGYVSCGGGPPSSDIRLRGGERGTDLALGVARPMASALPWMTSASGVEIRSADGSGDSWWSVWPCDRGAPLSGSGDEARR